MKKRFIVVLSCFLFSFTANAVEVEVQDAEKIDIKSDRITIIRKQNNSGNATQQQGSTNAGSNSETETAGAENKFEKFCKNNNGTLSDSTCMIENKDPFPNPDGIKSDLKELAKASNNDCGKTITYGDSIYSVNCKGNYTLGIKINVNNMNCSEGNETFNQETGDCEKSEEQAPAEEPDVGESSDTEGRSESAVSTPQNETQEKSFHERFKNVCKKLELTFNSEATYDSNKHTCEIKPAEVSISLSDIESIIPSVIGDFQAKNIVCQKVKYLQYKKIWSMTCQDNTTSNKATIIFDYSDATITCDYDDDYSFAHKTGKCIKDENDEDEEAAEEAPRETTDQATAVPPDSENEGKTANAGTTQKTEATFIEQLHKDAEQIVTAYKDTLKTLKERAGS